MTYDIRECGIADLDLADESVDLVCTDPPYPREFVPLFGALGDFAARVLKPSGSLVVMSGHLFLPDVVALLGRGGLQYKWTLACMTPGSNGRIWPRHIYQGWKPIFWYAKGDAMPRRWLEDRIISRPDKCFHTWGQSLPVFEQLVNAFSNRGDLVCDPFLGAGTTAIAAVLQGRSFVGCDIDPDAVRKAQLRLRAVDDYLAATRARA